MKPSLKLFLASLLFLSSVVQGFVLMGPKWPAFPVAYEINPSGGPAGNDVAIKAGFDTWEAVKGVIVSFNYRGTTSRTLAAQDGVNTVGWGTSIQGPGSLAVTLVWWTSSNLVEADMEFNTNEPWSTSAPTTPPPFDIETVALHEAGHFIGIDHTPDASAVMYFQYGGRQRTLDDDDIAAVKALYPGKELEIVSNAPNPFKPNSASDVTRIFFDVNQAGRVSLNIYNIAGELVTNLLETELTEGSYYTDWNGDNGTTTSFGKPVGSGVYILVGTSSAGGKDTRKIMVIR